MKFRSLYLIFIAIGIYILNAGSSTGVGSVLNNGFTGAPGEEPGCFASSCHTDGNAFNNVTTIEVLDKSTNLPVTAYDPGVVYEVRVTIDAPGAAAYGFQMVCLNSADNSDVASFTNPGADVKVITAAITSRQYAEQSAKSTTNTFTVDWTAPSATASADVTFYASGNAVNGDNMFSGDDPANATLTLTKSAASGVEDQNIKFKMNLFPLPTSDQLNISVEGEFKGDFFLEVFNDVGMLMFEKEINLNRGINDLSIDVSAYSAGNYTLRIYQNNQYKSGRFIKI